MDIHFDCQPNNSNKAISSIYSEMLENPDLLNLRPGYQRSAVWDKDQKGNLIDSIMRGCPMPLFLIYAYRCDTNECIDGQNRLTAIKEYIEQDDQDPWAWIQEQEDRIEYIFFRNPKTEEAMRSYCEVKTKWSMRGRHHHTKPKVYRLMDPLEMKTFFHYKCTFSEISTKLTFDQRKDIFLRWQSGTGISQCDRFKNNDTPFCNVVVEHALEHTLAVHISGMLRSGRKNWLFDLHRLVYVFHEGYEDPASVLISTIKSRTRIDRKSAFSPAEKEELTNAVRRCEKFLTRFSFLKSMKKHMKISFLLALAYVWNHSVDSIREIMEQEAFMVEFVESVWSDESMKHNTLNNGPNESSVLETFPRFKRVLMTACDEYDDSVSAVSPTHHDNHHKPTKKKEPIPAARKTEVWNKYVGETVGKAKCWCCGLRDMTARDFIAGHVVPEKHGGTIGVDNLRPICSPCNSGMGSRNMGAWQKKMYPDVKTDLV